MKIEGLFQNDSHLEGYKTDHDSNLRQSSKKQVIQMQIIYTVIIILDIKFFKWTTLKILNKKRSLRL